MNTLLLIHHNAPRIQFINLFANHTGIDADIIDDVLTPETETQLRDLLYTHTFDPRVAFRLSLFFLWFIDIIRQIVTPPPLLRNPNHLPPIDTSVLDSQ